MRECEGTCGFFGTEMVRTDVFMFDGQPQAGFLIPFCIYLLLGPFPGT